MSSGVGRGVKTTNAQQQCLAPGFQTHVPEYPDQDAFNRALVPIHGETLQKR